MTGITCQACGKCIIDILMGQCPFCHGWLCFLCAKPHKCPLCGKAIPESAYEGGYGK
jgi:hypothetical protein